MSPVPIRIPGFEPGEPSTSTSTPDADTMHIQSTLLSRSARGVGGNSGVEGNTVIFIVIGVVCLLVILIGFYRVSRPRAAHNVAPSSPSQHIQHSPIARPPPLRLRPERDMRRCWRIWKKWRHSSTVNDPAIPDTPVSQVSPAPVTINNPSPAILARSESDSKTSPPPPSPSRPEQSRRVTSLSVTTSFSHSHITEEALNDFRASAYDLDGDLETEMLNSARDEFWWGHPFAVEEGCGKGVSMCVEEAVGAGHNVDAIPIVGVAEFGGDSPQRVITAHCGGDDYENAGRCHALASGGDDMEKQCPC